MAQIIDEYRGLGNALGTGLGQGLGHGLNKLTEMKLNQITQRESAKQAARSYEKFGIPSNIAEALASLSPEERKYPLQNLGALLQLGNTQQPQTASSALQGLEQAPAPTPGGSQPVDEKAKVIENIFTSPHERREQEKLNLKKSDTDRKNSKEIREYLAPGDKVEKAAKSNIRDYEVIEKLARKGDLRSGATQQLLSKVGLEDFNLNYSSQLANKLIARLAQNSQAAFGPGTRITNFLEKTFQRSLPTLWNTKEGIIGIAQINKFSDQVLIEEQKMRRDIIKENRGNIPADIEAQVDERLAPIRDRLEEQAMQVALGLDKSRMVDSVPSNYTGRVKEPSGKIVRYENGKKVNG